MNSWTPSMPSCHFQRCVVCNDSLWKDCYSRGSDCPKKDKYAYSGTFQGIAYAMAWTSVWISWHRFYRRWDFQETRQEEGFSPVGCLDSTSNTLHGVIDIALMQSCFENDEVKPFVKGYGMVIVDECHHVSSITFENVLKHVTAHYVYGLTATPIRKDGLQPIIFMQCGPIRFLPMLKHRYRSSRSSVILCRDLHLTGLLPMTNNRLRHYHNSSLNRKYGIIL